MSDTPNPTTPGPASTPRGYFNKSQLEDLDQAESILAAALAHAAMLDEQEITATYLDGFSAHLAETRHRASGHAQGGSDAKTATELSSAAASSLVTALQQIQSAAKQKHQMLAEDGDPATHFPTDGYLLGTRLNRSRASLLQSADALVRRIKSDSLPGYKTPAKIAAMEALVSAYRGTEDHQQETIRDKELARLNRDELIHILNTRRSSIQHAADTLWPWSVEANRPIRKSFSLPLNRPMGI